MATAQVLKAAHNVEDGFKTVGKGVECVDDKVNDVINEVNLVIEGMFSALTTRTFHRKHTRLDGNVAKQTTMESKAPVRQIAKKKKREDRCS